MNLLELVNEYLEKGGTISQFEKDNNYGKDTIRKKLNREGFYYDRKIKKFVFRDCNIKKNDTSKEKICDKNHIELENKKLNSEDNFTSDEIKTLKEIVYKYQLKKERATKELSSKSVLRSFRVDENVLKEFISFCKKNNLKQTEMVSKALKFFIEFYNF